MAKSLKRTYRIGKFIAYRETWWNGKDMVWTFLGSFLGIGLIAFFQERYLAPSDQVFLIGSFGATSVLIYGVIQSPLAQPRNLVGGHLISALIGVSIAQWFPDILWITAPLAVSTSIIAMQVTKTLHPPGGATALIAVAGSEKIKALGYFYVVFPVLTGVLTLLLIALIVNNLTSERQYPASGRIVRVVYRVRRKKDHPNPYKCMKSYVLILSALLVWSCQTQQDSTSLTYFAPNSDSVQTGGVKLIPVETPKGTFQVWTKRVGNHPSIKVLLLNGGPGATHEYFECFENFFPAEGIEFIYYDQLGCGNSENPQDTTLWDLPRYVEEVEQVRKALKLDETNFYLLGHSWGGILAMEYALKYQKNMKGLIISNMMSSCPEYGQYADQVLAKQLPAEVLKEVRAIEARNDFSNPRYMELLIPHFYEKHVLRFPSAQWPEPVNRSFAKMNQSLYVTMQGPSEFGIAGKLAKWDRKANLKDIQIPALVIGAQHDTMDPKHMEEMSKLLPKGHYVYCPKGSHMAFYDDQKTYFEGLITFLKH